MNWMQNVWHTMLGECVLYIRSPQSDVVWKSIVDNVILFIMADSFQPDRTTNNSSSLLLLLLLRHNRSYLQIQRQRNCMRDIYFHITILSFPLTLLFLLLLLRLLFCGVFVFGFFLVVVCVICVDIVLKKIHFPSSNLGALFNDRYTICPHPQRIFLFRFIVGVPTRLTLHTYMCYDYDQFRWLSFFFFFRLFCFQYIFNSNAKSA